MRKMLAWFLRLDHVGKDGQYGRERGRGGCIRAGMPATPRAQLGR